MKEARIQRPFGQFDSPHTKTALKVTGGVAVLEMKFNEKKYADMMVDVLNHLGIEVAERQPNRIVIYPVPNGCSFSQSYDQTFPTVFILEAGEVKLIFRNLGNMSIVSENEDAVSQLLDVLRARKVDGGEPNEFYVE